MAEKDERISQNIKELESVNTKLAAAKKELDSYWKREYEIESDSVLVEKIRSYEKTYPKLKELRKTICIGDSPSFLRVLRQVVPQSQMSIPSWIYGESGVGKTALARIIHTLSPRSERPFQAFAASEFAAADQIFVMGNLFGYGPGHGIRGIDKNGQKGILEGCDSGTLFIDDVDALPAETQAQLLRVVDGMSFHPAAGNAQSITVDVRFLFATHVDLEQRVKDGVFRKDLFRRMGASYNKIEIPALRDRKSDISLLARHFVKNYNKRFNANFHVTDETLNMLMSHNYMEGNIAELSVLIELACENARIDGDPNLSEKHFSRLLQTTAEQDRDSDFSSSLFNEKEMKELVILRKNNFRMQMSEEELGFNKDSKTLSHHLRGMCLKALVHTQWHIEEASSHLTGDDLNPKIQKTIEHRIEGYINNLTIKGNSEQKQSLYKNLPKEYHSFVDQGLEHYNNNS